MCAMSDRDLMRMAAANHLVGDLRHEAYMEVYGETTPDERLQLDINAQKLSNKVERVGKQYALEILMALGVFLNEEFEKENARKRAQREALGL